MAISDETDLVKAAYFDISAFIAAKSLLDTKNIWTGSSSGIIPDFILENALAEVFTVPHDAKFEV